MNIEAIYDKFKACSQVCTDTRKIVPNCLFVALKGDNFNGNKFAADAIANGAKFAIIDEKEYECDNAILVKNVLDTLQQLANYHRKQFDIPFIGITGSNGKTTSKELINSVLSQQFNTHFTKGNFNNHIGVPLTLLDIKEDCEIAIIEMGANHIGEINALCRIAAPNFGIITNIGTAHIEGFGSQEGVKIGKGEMYKYIAENGKLIFVNHDDETLTEMASNIENYTYGSQNADCCGELIYDSPNVRLKWNDEIIDSTLYGGYNYNNILLAIAVGQYFNVEATKIRKGIETYVSENNRSQLIKLKTIDIYLDAYNANPSSMEVAMKSFELNDGTKKLMILGDMLELGHVSSEKHTEVVERAKIMETKSIFIGKEFFKVQEKHDFKFFEKVEDLIEYQNNTPLDFDTVLIKGSRGIRLEKFAEELQKKELL